MSYIGNTPGVSSQRVVLEEVVSGSPKSTFVPQSGYIIGYVDVLVNGLEIDSSDFTAPDGVNINLVTAAAVGDTVKVKTWLPRGLSDGYLKTEADARFLNLAGGQLTGNLGLGIAPKAWGLGKAIDINNGALFGYSSGGVTGITLAYNTYYDGSAWKAKTTGASSMIQLGAGTLGFYTAPSVSADANTSIALGFSVDANGNASPAGNLVLGNGKGIDFGANPNLPGATIELLDDYERGTWQPSLYFGGSLHDGSYSYQSGHYVKVGNLVSVYGIVGISTAGTRSGLATMTLPFVGGASGSGSVTMGLYNSFNGLAGTCIFGDGPGGAQTVALYTCSTSGYAGLYRSNFTPSGGNYIEFAFTYIAA